MRTSPLVIRSSIIAALGGFLFGFDTIVISGTTKSLATLYHLNEWWLGFTVTIALIGTIIGSATVQAPTNRFGRKPVLIVMGLLFLVSAIGCAFPWDWYSFLFFRFIGGLAIGAASVVSPLYTAEIAPARIRGTLVAITQFNIVFGILVAFISNYLISMLAVKMNFTADAWRVMFGVGAIPAAVFFVLMFLNPESPRWLLTRNRDEEAKKLLALLGSDNESVDEEMKIIRDSIESDKRKGAEKLFARRYRIPIMLAFCIAAFNQLSGINAILYYAPAVFRLAGASEDNSMFSSMIIGLTNMIFTIAAMFVIDRLGRRKLMLVGSIGYILSLSIVAGAFIVYGTEFKASIATIEHKDLAKKVGELEQELGKAPRESKEFLQSELDTLKGKLGNAESGKADAFDRLTKKTGVKPASDTNIVPFLANMLVLGGLMFFIASHAFGQGACIWVFIGEIFPNNIRAQGQAFGSLTHWVFAAMIAQSFPLALAKIGPANIFLIFAGFMVLQLLWVRFIMPETKQIPLEEMQKVLKIDY